MYKENSYIYIISYFDRDKLVEDMNKTIRDIIDSIIDKDIDVQIDAIERILDILFPYISTSYDHSRECVQTAISELSRISKVALPYMQTKSFQCISSISSHFENTPSSSIDYLEEIPGIDIMDILQKIDPLMAGPQRADVLNIEIADALSYEERRTFSNFIAQSIATYAGETEWDKFRIENHMFYLSPMYSIGMKDGVMDLFFNFYYSLLDKLAHSGLYQQTRDIAENLLIIGHNQGLLPDAYLGASRAYTAANNPIAGFLYLNFTLFCLNGKQRIPQRLSYEILWQFLKTSRSAGHITSQQIDTILSIYDHLHCNDEDMMIINHTALSIRLYLGADDFKIHALEFLDRNRELFFSQLERGSMPWLSLIKSFRSKYPQSDVGGLEFYEKAVESIVPSKGNELYLDLYGDGHDLEKHLKELLVKLQSTRSKEDFVHDNYTALVVAKKLLSKAVKDSNPGAFILAMMPKSDYTFVMKETTPEQYAQFNIDPVNGEDYTFLYEKPSGLNALIGADDSDIVIWIGKGTDSYYSMAFIRGAYSFYELPQLNEINVRSIQDDVIGNQCYQKSIKPVNGPIYTKSNDELEEESDIIKGKMINACFGLPNIASRCLFVKDIEIAGLPHNLLIDNRSGEFVGRLLPTCNIISSEFLIKSNFEEMLPEKFSKNFWAPIESGEFTFSEIYGRLEDILTKNSFTVFTDVVPDHPLAADLNILCAHGGKNIGETEWFYANDNPIIETKRIVGTGKLLVLFVCHSGSIRHDSNDNAMHTIIKQYLSMGYSAVVAPMWSLATEILPCWLSSFIERINSHDYVIDAVYKANMSVKEEYVSVSAWGCMHLFGNPYLQINDNPRLRVQLDDKQ